MIQDSPDRPEGRDAHFLDDIAFLTRTNTPEHLVYAVNISLKFGYLYFETPKVACSTIKRFLIKNELSDIRLFDTGDLSYREFDYLHDRAFSPLLNLRQLYPVRPKIEEGRFFRFCFVRNPYDRLLSAYLDKIRRNLPQSRQIKQVLGLPEREPAEIGFADFVSAVARIPPPLMDAHWRVQYDHNCVAELEYDFIGRIEAFGDGMAEVCARTGLDPAHLQSFAPHAVDAGAHLAEFYTDALREQVHAIYRRDFEAFGYPA